MSDYVPTTNAVRSFYIGIRKQPDDEAAAEFDRWLTAHDRKVAAEALREAAETFVRTVGEPAHPGRSVVCLDMKTGVVTDVQTWLRARATHLHENGGE